VQNEKERLERELERTKTDHRAQLEQLRAQRTQRASELAETEVQRERAQDHEEQLEEQLASEKKFAKDTEAKLRAVQGEFAAIQARCFHAEQSAAELAASNDVNAKIAADSEKELLTAHHALAACQGDLSRLQSRVPALEDELEHHKTHSQEELARAKTEIDALLKKTQKTDSQLRVEYSARLDELFAQNQTLHEEKQRISLSKAQESYEEKLTGYRDQLEQSGHDLALALERNASLTRDQQVLSNQLQQEQQAHGDTRRVVEQLREQVDSERGASKAKLREKVEVIQQIKEAFKRKDRELDLLMRMKVALGLELRALRMMVEDEETRMGYNFSELFAPKPAEARGIKRKQAPTATDDESSSSSGGNSGAEEEAEQKAAQQAPRRSKRAKANEAASASSEEEEESSSSSDDMQEIESHLVSGRDEHGRYVMLHNGADERVLLAGWKIRSQLTSDEYEFDKQHVIEKNSYMRLRYASQEDEERAENALVADDGETIWLDEDLFAKEGDKGFLVNPADEVKASVEIIGQSGVGARAVYQPERGCRLM
jgi:hypothetical protein